MATRQAILFAAGAAVAAAGSAALTARSAVGVLEARVVGQISAGLETADDWVELTPSGTVLTISGTAPDRSAQIAALARIGAVAGGIRIEDQTRIGAEVAAASAAPEPVQAQVEILKSDGAVTLFGTIPQDQDLAAEEAFAGLTITNMLTGAPGPEDPLWEGSVAVALAALDALPRGRVSVEPGSVQVTATAASVAERDAWVSALEAAATGDVSIRHDITVPREVIAPYVFTARLAPNESIPFLTACTAETAAAAARLAGLGGGADCDIGLGAPSPEWETAVTVALAAVDALGAGSVDISDADIAVTGPQGLDADAFARAMDALRRDLPEAFSLSASLPPPPDPQEVPEALEPPRFTAVRTEDGAVRIRGDVNDEQIGQTAGTFAEAKFGFDTVINQTAIREDLPSEWAVRIFGGLEALGGLTTGQLEVTEGAVTLTGAATTLEMRETIETRLRDRLPDGAEIVIEVWEAEALEVDPLAQIPADLCAEQIDLILTSASITFPPGETDIDATSLPIIDRIADVLQGCPGARFEIGGHTDSQGRESSNLAISQSRADAVLTALLERNIDTVFLNARGYGETQPIADNETEEGRARNRRIAFRLLAEPSEPVVEGGGPVLQAEGDAADGDAPEIETARRQSPTTIVVPAGTDPASVLPPSAAEAAAEAEAVGEETADQPAAAEEGEAVAAVDPNAATEETAPDATEGTTPRVEAGEPAENAAEAAEGAPAAEPADPAEEEVAKTAPNPSDDPDLIRPMPRRGNLPGSGN